MLSHAWVEWIGLVKTFCPTFWRRPSAKKNILAAWVGVANYVAFARVKLLLPAAVSSFHMETCVKTSSIAWEHDVLSWNNTCLYSGRHGCDHQHYAISSHGVRKKKTVGKFSYFITQLCGVYAGTMLDKLWKSTLMSCLCPGWNILKNKTNKQTNKQNKQTNTQTNKQTTYELFEFQIKTIDISTWHMCLACVLAAMDASIYPWEQLRCKDAYRRFANK